MGVLASLLPAGVRGLFRVWRVDVDQGGGVTVSYLERSRLGSKMVISVVLWRHKSDNNNSV